MKSNEFKKQEDFIAKNKARYSTTGRKESSKQLDHGTYRVRLLLNLSSRKSE